MCMGCIAPASEERVDKGEEEAPVSAEEQKNKALVRWWYEEVWGKGNLAAVDEFMAPNYVEHTVPPRLAAGARRPQAARRHVSRGLPRCEARPA
jgi:hypothetical protein